MRCMSITGMIVAALVLYSSDSHPAGLNSDYCLASVRYFDVSQELVDDLQDAQVATEEIPVVLFIAQRCKTEPERIAQLRTGGASWMSILESFSLGPEVFFMRIAGDINSRVYAPIFAKYRSMSEQEWRSMPMADEEVVNLVNLKFISSHHDYSVFEVMAMRDYGKSFPRINQQVGHAKEELIAKMKNSWKEAAKAGM